ncbi:MAG TPA: STAS domain-containing protein [Solirubrobacteraceae bacterium]|nr:STAS domain-containing protein [Solirubrobacteraceae bacterium]
MLTRAHNIDDGATLPAPFGIGREELDERTSVIAVEGDLDLSTAPQLKFMLADAIEEGHSVLVVDLTETTFMDSTALGVLVGTNRSLAADGRIVIVCTRQTVLKIFEFSGMDGVFGVFGTLDDALAHARGQNREAG